MNNSIRSPLFVGVAAFILTTFFALPLFTKHDLSAQDPLRESDTCLDCHEDQQLSLLGTPHQIIIGKENMKVMCTDCHAGSADHFDEDPEEYPMTNPANVDAWNEAQICAQCHVNSHQQNAQERNVHTMNHVNCSDCHRVHVVHGADSTFGGGQYSETHYTGLLKTNEIDLCLDCHSNVRGEFNKPTHHPLVEGIVKCSDCHMLLDRTAKMLSVMGTNSPCFQCHNEFQMPFPYEHQATVDFSIQEGACINCHVPHGSYLPRMLNQPYEGPHYQLCSQCHSVPRHNFNSFHGSTWSGVPCNDCHVDIHGSFTNRLFLSPELQAQGCFNVGCHQL